MEGGVPSQIEWDPVPDNEDYSGEWCYMTVDANATGIGAALVVSADGNLDEADADADATMPCFALALEAGTGTKKVLLRGFITDTGWNWTTVGAPIYISTTTGALTDTAPAGSGDYVQRVGIATHADRLFFLPSLDEIKVA